LVHEVFWKKSVSKDIKRITQERQDKLINKIEKTLSKKAKQGEKLKGKFEGFYKLRIGDYRVIYTFIPKGVLVLRVRHRKNAYK